MCYESSTSGVTVAQEEEQSHVEVSLGKTMNLTITTNVSIDV